METNEIQEDIGEMLAAGETDESIISALEENADLSPKDAYEALRAVYDGWQHTREELDLDDGNLKDWHVYLRKHILKTALKESTTSSLRLALSVLDSLATIQGISTEQGQTMPLAITLVEKKEEVSGEVDTEGSDAANHD